MNQGIYPLSAAMINQLNRVDTISNNLANSRTTGFKQDGLSEGSFNYYLQRVEQEGRVATKESTVTNTIPKIDGKYIDETVGMISPTGNTFDFALKQRDTFFQVMNDKGNIELTRDGTFHNVNGELVTKNGFNVLSADGEPIVIEDDAFGQAVGVIKTAFDNLEKIGNNNYKAKNDEMTDIIEDNEMYVMQGALEKSNVNTVSTMVALIDAQRRFEQAQKGIQTIDDINRGLIEKIGRPA
ncbi:MAG: flagellar hook-basal body protein [Campylobacterota bacterium]|nr:flagellar hook-basal body protein [Campylobacterota bacterium]